MELPFWTNEQTGYRDSWACNAAHFEKQDCYQWMAEQLRPLQPQRILDIGCGTGEGVLALLKAYSPTVISLEENGDCIRHSSETIASAGYDVEPIHRLGYEEFPDGTHLIYRSNEPIRVSRQVSLVQADVLLPDTTAFGFLEECPPFDAVTIWLMGTVMARQTCRNLASARIADGQNYRLRVQNRIYELADRVLRPGGWLQVVDRGEPPRTQPLRDDLIQGHREQAQPTSLEVFALEYREYTEPKNKGINMVASPGTSGRIADMSTLAMFSILSRKPAL